MRELGRTRQRWERLGRKDPLWGVLSDDSKKGNRWDSEEFLATGRAEIDACLARLEELGVEPSGLALDLGCGAGRLTQALAAQLGEAVGVDISASMIAKAEQLNRQRTACRFVQNTGGDLSGFADGAFGFVYSVLVLQHMPAAVAQGYLGEFCRVLRPGGVAVFQIPTGRSSGWRARRIRADLGVRRLWRSMDIHAVAPERVREILEERGCLVLAQDPDWRAGGGWRSATFYAQKQHAR